MAQPNYPPGRPANPPPASGGTPKIVPVLVSMGVAIGTFCGLYFGLGTKEDEAAADPSGEVATGSGGEGSGSAGAGSAAVEPDKTGSGSGSGSSEGSGSGSDAVAVATVDAGAGSGSGSAVAVATVDAGAGSGSAVAVATIDAGAGSGSAEPALTEATVQFSVIPPTAEVMVDGKPVEGGVVTIALTNGKKAVKITAKASGYRSFEKKMTIDGDQLVSFKMQRRGGSSGSSGSNSGAGEKIDLGKIDM